MSLRRWICMNHLLSLLRVPVFLKSAEFRKMATPITDLLDYQTAEAVADEHNWPLDHLL
jgi:hypothetical protein